MEGKALRRWPAAWTGMGMRHGEATAEILQPWGRIAPTALSPQPAVPRYGGFCSQERV